ncbi:MAG: hypothetical protein ABI247_10850 [Rhodanobacter sp.]
MSYACPICGASLDPVPRYPRYVCADCATKAVVADGRRLQFSNLDMSGGFVAGFAPTGENHSSYACWIERTSCHADEVEIPA